MPGDSEATKRRLLDAAAREFAAYGIAGARVDRIAESAKANKAQIYHYFGSKDELFDAMFNEMVGLTTREAPLDPLDLAGYAARLCDRFEEHPYLGRLAAWYRLERAETQAPLESILRANRDKVERIEAAQRAGKLPDRFSAPDLLALVVTVAGMWTALTPEHNELLETRTREQRRQVVVDAVTTLIGDL